jgi:hypothetical protein
VEAAAAAARFSPRRAITWEREILGLRGTKPRPFALAVLFGTLVVGAVSSLFVVVEEEEAVRVCVLEAGTGIFEEFENESVVKGWSKIFLNDAPFPPLTLLEPSPLVFGFEARTGDVTPFEILFSLSFAARSDVLFCCVMPVPVVRLARLGPGPEAEGRDFANELAVGARSVEEVRFTPVLPEVRPVPMLLLLLTLLTRLFAVPSVLVALSDPRFL